MDPSPSAADWAEVCASRETFSFNIHDGLDRASGLGDLEHSGRLPRVPRARRISRRALRLAPTEGIAAD